MLWMLDRDLIAVEVEKYSHPLEDNRPHLYNPVSGQVAVADINVADSIVIGDKMEREYIASLPNGFLQPYQQSHQDNVYSEEAD